MPDQEHGRLVPLEPDVDASNKQFLADAAHQMRTPIARIQAGTEALLGGASPEDQERLLADIARETARSARLVSAMLRMARLDEGETVTKAPTDVVALCCDEVDRAWTMSPTLDIVVSAGDLPKEPPPMDANAVREILANLLDNARRHALSKVEVVVGSRDTEVEIRVVDDGPGLPDDLVDRAFQRFASLDERGGSGLGLPIARALARAHGGDLTYDAGFVLTLPIPPAAG